jgi:hypothetical protein
VATDEKVRKELDRKLHVDYLKDKNQEQLQQSMTKLRESQSPVKRYSPTKSPGKY